MMGALVNKKNQPLWVSAIGLVLLPFLMRAIGLTLDNATVLVIFAMAAMGLNLLVGTTGLTGSASAATRRRWRRSTGSRIRSSRRSCSPSSRPRRWPRSSAS